ncbi:protein TolQ [Pseudomonas sp. FSL R10-2398]|uniref:protein TolQ n=1 Tax=Pseudomonas sp. FSL R10-2398 TaxID=2662201 RepID=UPI00129535A6|nr:protein TolQ [Pseudomonas sp. FSL R10-2398]MQT54977.1 protein TolQ [Pseudomonas sp. FSL R10-2398]
MQATMEHMTIWGLINDASLLVKGVMLILLAASVLSWFLIVRRSAILRRSERDIESFTQRLRAPGDLGALYRESRDASNPDAGAEQVFVAAYSEYAQLRQQPGIDADGLMQGIERSLYVAITEQEIRLEKGLQFLATVGSVSPYIGLFGTVWGIMNSFIGLSQVQQATLSTVAPGIAEALIATAIGLFAAIPAVIAYNRFSSCGQTLLTRYYSLGNELQMRLYRGFHAGSRNMAAAA